jgi:hypothetical protein
MFVRKQTARGVPAVTHARLQQQNGGWGMFTTGWWQSRESDALDAIRNLRKVYERMPVVLGHN